MIHFNTILTNIIKKVHKIIKFSNVSFYFIDQFIKILNYV